MFQEVDLLPAATVDITQAAIELTTEPLHKAICMMDLSAIERLAPTYSELNSPETQVLVLTKDNLYTTLTCNVTERG